LSTEKLQQKRSYKLQVITNHQDTTQTNRMSG